MCVNTDPVRLTDSQTNEKHAKGGVLSGLDKRGERKRRTEHGVIWEITEFGWKAPTPGNHDHRTKHTHTHSTPQERKHGEASVQN